MKTFKTSFFLLSLFVITGFNAAAFAPEKTVKDNCSLSSLKSAITKTNKYRTFRFTMKNEEDSPVTIHLKDKNGEILYMKKLKKGGDFATDFNFVNMPDGTYMVEMVKKNCISKQALTL